MGTPATEPRKERVCGWPSSTDTIGAFRCAIDHPSFREAGDPTPAVFVGDGAAAQDGPGDEAPDWAPSSRELIFQRAGLDGRPALYRVAISGGEARRVVTPQDGSDPDWSGVID